MLFYSCLLSSSRITKMLNLYDTHTHTHTHTHTSVEDTSTVD